jgi:glycosyltransferase involved in cell wall biosynthesis
MHVDQLWFPAAGGIGTYVRELLHELPAAGAELEPFWVARHGDTARVDLSPAPVDVPGSIRSLYPRWALTRRPPLPESIGSCDVVHATNHAAIPPARDRQALVATVHDLAFDRFPELFPTGWRWMYRAGVRAAIRHAHLLLTPSMATADDLAARGTDASRIRVTPLAASLPATGLEVEPVLARLGIEPPYVLAPGTIEPRKNQVRLIRAYRQVAPEVPHSLVLAGPDGWGGHEVNAELARGGAGRVIRTGRLDEASLDAAYRGADLVAYISLYEGFGLPIVEAMQRGVAVLTSTTPACAETAGDAAVLVDPEDVGGTADALAALLTDPARREDLASRGRVRAARFSWAGTARATLDAYGEARELAQGARR